MHFDSLVGLFGLFPLFFFLLLVAAFVVYEERSEPASHPFFLLFFSLEFFRYIL